MGQSLTTDALLKTYNPNAIAKVQDFVNKTAAAKKAQAKPQITVPVGAKAPTKPATDSKVPWTSKRPQPSVDHNYSGKQELGEKYIVVQKGNTAWDVAKSGLQSKGVKATNADVMKEINRLAKINGCSDLKALEKKFTIGAKIKTEGYSPETAHHAKAKTTPEIVKNETFAVPKFGAVTKK